MRKAMPYIISGLVLSAPLLFLSTNSCTDAGLQPIVEDQVEYLDDKLMIEGDFCTSPSDEVTFPVKILIAMDQSASLQCTDPGNNRLAALDLMGAQLDPLPNVEFGVVGFASWSRITEFTPEWNVAREALAPESGMGGPATDYQGALSTVLRVLEQDILASGPAETSRTKYIVLFMSDGVPEPRCIAGCDDGDEPPDSLYGVCNTLEDIPDDVYVDMTSICPDYNQPEQIMQKVQDIMSLGTFHGVGDISMSTVLLFAPEDEVAAVCGDVTQFGYVREEAIPLLTAIAEEGLGTFRDVNISTELDFLDFNYESLRAPYWLSNFFALNMSAVPIESGFGIDTDRDGIPDEAEFTVGLDRFSRDTDGDQFSDLFETRFSTKGFDPMDRHVPAMGCADTLDRDGDGLLGCEEDFIGSDPLLTDSDGDRIPDGIELRLGTDPIIHDTQVDHDFDGALSGLEISMGTSPTLANEEDMLTDSVHYSVDMGTFDQMEENRCYYFTVSGLTLVPTLKGMTEADVSGLNRVLVIGEEEPEGMAGSKGRFWVACIETRYLGETYKQPASGEIRGLNPMRFVELPEFDPALHCLPPGGDPTVPIVEEAK